MAEIYIHIPDGEQLSIVPEASSSQDWALMGDNKLSLSFQRYECLILPAGAWCEFDGVIFYLLQEYKPTMIHSHLWQYNVAFVDGASWLGVTTALKTIDGEDAPLFTLTAPAAEHAAIIVSNVNRRLGGTVWKVGSVIDTPNITIEYTGKYCGAVLQEIVDDQNTEWWVDGTTLNIGRAEFGSLIELGYRDGLLGDITVTQADNMSSYRTLYPVGSTRNILPTEYGHDRLQLPNGQKSVMMNPAGVAELVEEAAFAGIYPRYKGKVTGVSTSIGQSNDGSQYLIYIVADTAIPFNPNEYEMPGLVKHITFQSGELMGAEFEVNYNPASKEFELITQFQENGSQLPGGMLIPQVGDEYVVWNISMPAEYYPLAEQELLEAAESFAAASTRESNVYKVKLDYIDVQERGLSLRPGQKVRLHSIDYFPEQGYYDSRITRVTRPVNYPGEYTIDVSAVRVVGSLTRLQTSLAAATTKVNNLSNAVQTVVQTVSNAVTLTGNQRVKGVKDFVDSIRINGSPVIEYDPVINTWLFRGNILAEGGMAAFSNIKGFTPSTITDAVLIDNRTIKQGADGLLYAVPQGAGGINEDQLADYLTTNGYATQLWVTGRGYITSAGSITGNAASATKLQNARSLWGQSFNGSADLTGSLTVTTGEGYRINYNGYDLRFIVSGNSANRGIWDNTLNSWMMYRDNSENVRFPKGNIGIGDASPSYKLHVRGTMGVTDVATFASSINLTSTPSQAFDGAQILLAGGNARIGSTASGFMGLYADTFTFRPSSTTSASTSSFTIDASANLATTGKLTLPIGSSNYTNASLWFGDAVRIGVNSSNSLGIFAGYAIRLNPDSASAASTTKGLWLLNTGKNGVNNTSPTEALDVTGNIKASGSLNLAGGLITYNAALNTWTLSGNLLTTGGVSAFSSIEGFTPSTITGAVMIDDTTIKRNAGGSLYAVMPNSINGDLSLSGRLTTQNNIVAEHSSNPFVAFKRNGTTWYCQVTSSGIKLGQTSAKSINVDASGNLTAVGSITPNTSSDERLKRNIRKFNAREVLMSLGGVYQYEYVDSEVAKNHIYEGTHYGLIYQHVKGTTLDVMCHERDDGFGTLNYIHPKFISLVAGATMENISEVEKLKREIRHLKAKVKQLEQRA